LDAEILREACSQMADRQDRLPFFRPGVIHDAQLAEAVLRVHHCLERESASILNKESCLLMLMIQLIRRHAEDSPTMRSTGTEHKAVTRAREYIESCYQEEISIKELSSTANLSPFHLIRVFGKEMGLPPHAYLTQVRVRRAKDLIANGWEISSAALETGFVDQSHLTRHFKRILGITPGKFRNFIQDK
jgi:AraC-like DNA-binding protein